MHVYGVGMCMCMLWVCAHDSMNVEIIENLQESVLSLCHVGPWLEFKWSGLEASTFTRGAIFHSGRNFLKVMILKPVVSTLGAYSVYSSSVKGSYVDVKQGLPHLFVLQTPNSTSTK